MKNYVVLVGSAGQGFSSQANSFSLRSEEKIFANRQKGKIIDKHKKAFYSIMYFSTRKYVFRLAIHLVVLF